MWSVFALSYGWVAILCGVNAIFWFGFSAGGPAFIWSWPAVGFIQLLIALCMAEMAGQVPVEGSMYQWSRHVTTSRFVPWITGWLLVAAMLVTLTVFGPQLQQLLTLISPSFEFVGGADDIGTATTHNGAINAIILGGICLLIVTVINIVSVRWTARVTNTIVSIELAAVLVVMVALALHIVRGPGIVFQTNGTGDGHPWGWFGGFLIAGISGAYVFFGFENAATVSEETHNPRKAGPKAILRALGLSVVMGVGMILLGLMAVKDTYAKELGTNGFPYVIQSVLGSGIGTLLLAVIVVANIGAAVAVQATGVRIIFAMARDGKLPFSKTLAHVPERFKTPVVATVFSAMVGVALLLVNYGNPRIFGTLGSLCVLLFYLCYLMVVGPMLVARIRGQWPRPGHKQHFSLGKWAWPVNIGAVLGAVLMIVNVAWPRPFVYGDDHWYLQYAPFTFVGLLVVVAVPYYLIVQRHKSDETMAEHRATGGNGSTDMPPELELTGPADR